MSTLIHLLHNDFQQAYLQEIPLLRKRHVDEGQHHMGLAGIKLHLELAMG